MYIQLSTHVRARAPCVGVFARAPTLAVDQNDVPISRGRERSDKKEEEERTSRAFEFKFRISTCRAPAPRGGTLRDGPGQPSDAVFGLAVLQFLNRIGRRRIPRDVDAKTFPVAYVYMYIYTCIYIYVYIGGNGDSIPEL